MFEVFRIYDQAWKFDSEKVKSELWNRFKLQIDMRHPVKIWTLEQSCEMSQIWQIYLCKNI